MHFGEFIKEKLLAIILLIFVIATIEIFFMIYDFGFSLKVYVPIAILVAYGIGIMVEYNIKRNFYQTTLKRLKEIDKKYLIAEVMDKPSFVEGKILLDILQQTDKAMIENVNFYKHLQEDYKEYIELWIHEVKLPIATGKLLIENNKNEVTKSIGEELDKIENYTEQALYYARSNTVEKDYCIKGTSLQEIVNGVILKNKNSLLQKHIQISIHDVDYTIPTDSKWCSFIMNQIVENSTKYIKEANPQIEIYGKEQKENLIVYIKDNGIGMKQEETKKVFEKGFTGENGRIMGKKSTGIGLYLCKKLCDKLGIGIELNSEKDIGTEVKLIFPKSSYTKF